MRKHHALLRAFTEGSRTFLYPTIKRLIDILLSLLLITLSLPVSCFIYWRIRKNERIAAFVKQRHIGKHGKPFMRLQFRTHAYPSSVIHAMPPQFLSQKWQNGVPDNIAMSDEMIGVLHQTGIFLRKYHIHHLPELLNVLKGEMSIVGPCSEIIEVAAYYNEEQRRRLLAKPGITGLAQLNQLTHEHHGEMMKQDLSYIDKRSVLLDMKIIWLTIIHYPNRYLMKRNLFSLHNHSIGE